MMFIFTGCEARYETYPNPQMINDKVKFEHISSQIVNKKDEFTIFKINDHEYFMYIKYAYLSYSQGGIIHNPDCQKCKEVNNGKNK